MLAIPGFVMVAFALVVTMGRYVGWVIVGVGIVMAYYLCKNWFAGGRQLVCRRPSADKFQPLMPRTEADKANDTTTFQL